MAIGAKLHDIPFLNSKPTEDTCICINLNLQSQCNNMKSLKTQTILSIDSQFGYFLATLIQ